MLYTAQTLTTEQKKQARDNIDAAIADFVVNVTASSDGKLTLDKTFTQIREAALGGKSVLMRIVASNKYTYVPLAYVDVGFCEFRVAAYEHDSIALHTVAVNSDNIIMQFSSIAPIFNSDGTLPQATMYADPTSPMEIATKKYVDDALAAIVDGTEVSY